MTRTNARACVFLCSCFELPIMLVSISISRTLLRAGVGEPRAPGYGPANGVGNYSFSPEKTEHTHFPHSDARMSPFNCNRERSVQERAFNPPLIRFSELSFRTAKPWALASRCE